jgi:hypothetical protein
MIDVALPHGPEHWIMVRVRSILQQSRTYGRREVAVLDHVELRRSEGSADTSHVDLEVGSD